MSLSEEERGSLVRQFCEVTGVAEEERARFYLEAAGWQLSVALSGFFESADDHHEDEEMPPASSGGVADSGGGGGGVTAAEVTGAGAVAAGGGAKQQKPPPPQIRPGVPMTLDALRAMMMGGESDDDDDDDKQAFYAGGSESSGQQVLGPTTGVGRGSGSSGGEKKKKLEEEKIIADVFKKAREHGAEEVTVGGSRVRPGVPAAAGRPAFQGAGYKLGSEETSSSGEAGTATTPTSSSSGPTRPQQQQREIVLRLWRGGFTVDNGGLRSYADPANVSFLDSVKRGEVPRELVTRGEEVSLTMEDRRTEDFVPPKQERVAFQGKGNVLGSPCPSVVAAPTTATSESDRLENERVARESIVLAEGAPRTNIQFRLADGTRLVGTFNHTHSVRDLHNFINAARPPMTSVNYVLTMFPSVTLNEMDKTLAEANVLNAALIQKIVSSQ